MTLVSASTGMRFVRLVKRLRNGRHLFQPRHVHHGATKCTEMEIGRTQLFYILCALCGSVVILADSLPVLRHQSTAIATANRMHVETAACFRPGAAIQPASPLAGLVTAVPRHQPAPYWNSALRSDRATLSSTAFARPASGPV